MTFVVEGSSLSRRFHQGRQMSLEFQALCVWMFKGGACESQSQSESESESETETERETGGETERVRERDRERANFYPR